MVAEHCIDHSLQSIESKDTPSSWLYVGNLNAIEARVAIGLQWYFEAGPVLRLLPEVVRV